MLHKATRYAGVQWQGGLDKETAWLATVASQGPGYHNDIE